MAKKCFDEADADKDGMLNQQEFMAYREKFLGHWRQMYGGNGCGDLCKPLSKDLEMMAFEAINSMNPDTPGIKKEDLGRTNMICQRMNMRPGAMYRIWYFAFYGRAECIRLMLTHAGVDWQDMPLTQEQWGKIKAIVPGNSLP